MPLPLAHSDTWTVELEVPARKRAISDCDTYASQSVVEIFDTLLDGEGRANPRERFEAKATFAEAVASWMEAQVTKHAWVTDADCNDEFAMASLFWARTVPGIDVRDYAARIARYGGCSPAALLVAFELAQRFLRAMDQRTRGDFTLNPFTVHRVLLACCVLGTKLQDDLLDDGEGDGASRGPPSTNSEWALVGGVSVHEVNRLELAVLQILDYATHVRPRQFMEAIETLWVQGHLVRAQCH